MPPRLLRRRTAVLTAGAVVLVAAATTLLLMTLRREGPAAAPTECRKPLAMNVLVSPDLEATITDIAAAFQRASRDKDECPEYAMTVYSAYSASLGKVTQAYLQRWRWRLEDRTSENFQPTRDVGPPPAIWIPGSSAEAWLAGGVPLEGTSASATASAPRLPTDQTPQIRVGKPLAWTHPVVAVSPALAERLPGGATNASARSWSWSELLPTLRQAGGELVRPNPTSSSVGLLHTIGLYSELKNAGDKIRELENQLNNNIRKDNYPAGDDTQMLCHYGSIARSDTKAALLVTDRSLRRYQTSNGGCEREPAELIPLEVDEVPTMDHPFVTVVWPGRLQDQRQRAAREFERWMRSDAEAQDRLGAATGSDPGTVAQEGSTRSAMTTYQQQRVRGRVLIALDTSALMTHTNSKDLNEGSPVDASRSAVAQAMTLLGTDDEVGLLTFNARSGGKPVIRTPVSLGRLNDKVGGQSRLSLLRTKNGTADDPDADQSPLYNVIDLGLSGLAKNRHSTDADISALVVIADGTNVVGETLTDLRRKLSSLQNTPGDIPVYVLAFHGNQCDNLNRALAGTVGGSCVVTTPAKVVNDLKARLAGLWKGAGQ